MTVKEIKEKIASLLKLDVAKINEVLTKADEEDASIELPEIESFTKDELSILKNNEYKAGKEKGVEMLVKEAKEKRGLEFQGKSLDGLLDAATKKALEDAKIEPAKQVTELTEKLKTVQATAQELQDKLSAKESEVTAIKTEAIIFKDMPTETTLPSQKILALMKIDGYDYKKEDGKIKWYKDGQEQNDKLGNSVDTKTIISTYVAENKLGKVDAGGGAAGRGGGNAGGTGTFTKLSEVKKHYEEQGKSVIGKDFSDEIAKITKENPEFKLDQ